MTSAPRAKRASGGDGDRLLVIELWPIAVLCGVCDCEGAWQDVREWYEGEPAIGSGFVMCICPGCLPTVDARVTRDLRLEENANG